MKQPGELTEHQKITRAHQLLAALTKSGGRSAQEGLWREYKCKNGPLCFFIDMIETPYALPSRTPIMVLDTRSQPNNMYYEIRDIDDVLLVLSQAKDSADLYNTFAGEIAIRDALKEPHAT